MVRNCRSVRQTKKFAFELSESIPSGYVIALLGNLGSGKTTFAQGFASGLGIKEHVGSPTFKIISEYTSMRYSRISLKPTGAARVDVRCSFSQSWRASWQAP